MKVAELIEKLKKCDPQSDVEIALEINDYFCSDTDICVYVFKDTVTISDTYNSYMGYEEKII